MLTQKEKQKIRSDKHRDKLLSTREGHIKHRYAALKYRTKKENVELSVSIDYLISIAPDICPVLGIKLGWCQKNNGIQSHSPSIDRINPNLGYVEGNVQWLSNLANTMKNKATNEQLHQFADWVKRTIPSP